MIFNERLKELRNSKGLSQRKLAEALNLHFRSIQSYELKTREPTLSNLIALAKYLEVSTDYLLGLTDNPKLY